MSANSDQFKTAFIFGLFSLSFFVSNALGASNGELISVPIVDDGTLIRVPVVLFGETRYFIVDTGTSATILDSRFAVRLQATGEVRSETTSGDSTQAAIYRSPSISIGGTLIHIEQVLCNDLSLQKMVTGEECDGILGMDVLRQYSVTIDLRKNELLMATNGGVSPNSENIGLLYMDGLPQVPIAIDGKGPELLIIDSGSSAALSFNEGAWDTIISAEEKKRAVSVLYSAGGGSINSSLRTRIKSVTFGSDQYSNVICQKISTNALSSLGLPFLRHNRVTLDFPHDTLYRNPNPGPLTDEQDMSGLHLLKQGGKIVVYSLDLNSPAAACGIRAGDVLDQIDDKPCTGMTMKAVRILFSGLDGEHRSVQVVRRDQMLNVNITLRKLI